MGYPGRLLVSAFCAVMALVFYTPVSNAESADSGRRIEEIVVTAEKRQSTVSDTSISITAFGEDMIEDLGLQGADELVNFIPATTRDAYDIRIRGVGRNFRALGGDPGVATYYNGVYSEDFGIAASESALFDLERIEVLRGPQGTLYGRNSIGGALNYITNKPSYETEVVLRAMFGNLGTKEYYGVLSGPIIANKLAYRLVGVRRDRDGSQEGIDGSEDVNTIADQNIAASLNWRVTDNTEFNVRYNDRRSDRVIGQSVLVTEGAETSSGDQLRGERSVSQYANGIVPVPGPTFGFFPWTGPTHTFTNPDTGESRTGIFARPGVDRSPINRPNAAYQTNPDVFDSDLKDLNGYALSNNRNDEEFKQQGVQADFTWDLNETTQLKWLGGWSEFDYTFHIDNDFSTSDLTTYYQRTWEAVETYSNELQLLWQIGDKLQMTSGLYHFNSDRRQRYSVNDDSAQGRFTDAVNYGGMTDFVSVPGTCPSGGGTGCVLLPHVSIGDAAAGTSIFGAAGGNGGDLYNGLIYGIDNTVDTDAYAAYTQGTYTFNDNWALTLGIRWARDEKSASEQRGGYVESDLSADTGFGPPAQGAFEFICTLPPAFGGFGLESCAQGGLTELAMMNIFMGNAVPNFSPLTTPDAPIVPTCALDDPNCATPLRLQGLPISFADASIPDKKSWEKVTWRANLEWTPTDSTLIYLGATTGYRSGGYSLGLLGTQSDFFDENGNPIAGQTGTSATYDEEEVMAVELGYKASLLDDRLQVFTSLYYYDYEGYQDEVSEFEPETGGGRNVVINVDEASNMGWEIEGTWLATDNWTIGGNYSLTETEYKSDVFVVEDDNPAVPNTLYDPKVVNLKGNQLKRIPKHKATMYSFYDLTFSPGTLTLGGTVSYTGSFYDSGIKRAYDKVPDRTRLDLSATWRSNDARWTIRGFVDNVTDEGRARGIGTATASANWNQTAQYLYPRFYGLDLTFRFNEF